MRLSLYHWATEAHQYTQTPRVGAAQLSWYNTPLLVVKLGSHNFQTFVAYPPSVTHGADGCLYRLTSHEFSLPNAAPC